MGSQLNFPRPADELDFIEPLQLKQALQLLQRFKTGG